VREPCRKQAAKKKRHVEAPKIVKLPAAARMEEWETKVGSV
jgi:hypothetical protein